MINTLLGNSYNILGLENTSSEKEILKRSKEILNLIEIDETPEYDLDIGPVKSLRTERNIKDSIQKLTDPKKRIKEYFFWFDLQDSVDEDAITNIRIQNFPKAISVWREEIKKDNSKSIYYQKNLAILYLILLSINDDDLNYYKESLELWKNIIRLDRFWNSYIKIYKLNDNLNTSSEIIDIFKDQVLKYLSDIYTALSQKNGKNYISDFSKAFNIKGEKLEKEVLNPIYNKINDAVEELEAMNITEDGVVDEDEITKVKTLLEKFQNELNKIIELGQYDDGQSKVIRDRAANAIRKTVLDIYNNLRDTEKSTALLNIALKISGTSGMIHKIEQDIKILEKNIKDDEIVDPILELVKAEKWEEALQLIQKQEIKHKNNTGLQEFFNNHKKMCVSLVALKKASEARKKLDAGNFDGSKGEYEEVISLINDNLDLYNVNQEQLQDYIKDIKSMISKVTIRNLSQVDEFRKNTWDMIDKNFKEEYEAYILKCLMDAHMFSMLTEFYKTAKNKATTVNILYWVALFVFFWQWWLGLLIAGGTWYYQNKS